MTTKTKFEWPEFNKDRDRIRAYSQRFKDATIAEAFEQAYHFKLKKNYDEESLINCPPGESRVGDIVKARILSIEKNHIICDTANFKSNVISNVNLYKYDKFKHFLPTDQIDLKVTKIQKDKIVVDPLAAMVDKFVLPKVQNPWIQKDIENATPVLVKNLQLTFGGFLGKAVIPTVSDFIGEEYTIDAFIPGSQIVLNIADDFNDFVGQDVYTFVVNYIPKPNQPNKMSLICSAKEYLKYQGEQIMINAFKAWTEENEQWEEFKNTKFEGKVTGIINTSKKCGVFIEIPSLNITGMVNTNPTELVNYKPKDVVEVKLDGFDEDVRFNTDAQQMQHVEPYIIEDNKIKKCNIKPILRFA